MEHYPVLLGFQLFPFKSPWEWLLIHRIKVVPAMNSHYILMNSSTYVTDIAINQERNKKTNKTATAYFSMNFLCWASSTSAKNSSISREVGICLLFACSVLLLASVEQVGLVVEPGVLTVSGSLIKLQGVDSRVVLQQIINIKLNIANSNK